MHDGQMKYLKGVLCVPTIAKNQVLIGQMVKQGLYVIFNHDGCFVEDMKNQGQLIANRKKNEKMFTLDVNMFHVDSMLFVHGKIVGNIGI
jgi:hypothetical protein